VSLASLGFLDMLVPYQSWFQLVSVALLLLAWGRLYRRRACLRNSRRTLWMLLAISVMLLVLLALPFVEWA
jgi:hypothetical protein